MAQKDEREWETYLFKVKLRRRSSPFKISPLSSSIFVFLYFCFEWCCCLVRIIGFWIFYELFFIVASWVFQNVFFIWFDFNIKKYFDCSLGFQKKRVSSPTVNFGCYIYTVNFCFEITSWIILFPEFMEWLFYGFKIVDLDNEMWPWEFILVYCAKK